MPSVRTTSVLFPITHALNITQFLYERDFETILRNSFFLLQVQSSSLSICHLFAQHLFCFLLHMRSILHNFYMKGILKLSLGIHSSCCRCSPLRLVYAICSHNICFVSYYTCAQFTQFLYERALRNNSSCCRCSPLPLVYAICSYNMSLVSYYICAQFTQFSYERDFETTPRNSFFLLQVQSSSLNLCHLFVQHLF